MTKPHPGFNSLAVLTNEQYLRDVVLLDAGAIPNTRMSFYNRVYKGTSFHEVYETAHYEFVQPLIQRITLDKHIQLRRDLKRCRWDDDAKELWFYSVELWKKIDAIVAGDEDVIMLSLSDVGIDPESMVRPFYPHQLQSLALHIELGFSCNWGQMRTGKTPPALVYIYYLLTKKEIDLAIIVVPNSIKRLWYNEIPKDMPEIMQALTCIIEGTKKKKAELWNDIRYKIKIVNYAGMRADIDVIRYALAGVRYLMVLDEVHNIKNADAKQTQAITSLKPTKLVCLSGTPVANKPEDVFSPLAFACSNLLGHSFREYKDMFCKIGGSSGTDITGYRKGALEDIHKRMFSISVRSTRESIGMLYGKTLEPRELEMSLPQRRAHDEANSQFRAELHAMGTYTAVTITSMLARLVRLQQIAAGYLPIYSETGGSQNGDVLWLEDKDNTKQKWLDNFIYQYLDDIGKLVIFSKFIPVIKKLYGRYKDKGATYVCGEVKPDERVYRVDELFRKDDATRILIINLDIAAGLEMNPCHFAVFHERSWYYMPNIQAEDRITGINQVRDATIIPLVCKNSIDSRLEFTVLPRKREMAKAIEEGDKSVAAESSLKITTQDLFDLVG